MAGAELINERGKSTKSLVGFESLSPTDSWISSEYHQCKCPSMFRRKLSQLSSDVLKATARATQSCWEKECKCSRADVVRAQLRTEQNAAAQRERSWLTDRHAQWHFKTQCHRFVAFLWKPGGILGDTSSLKTPTHHYMLAGSQRSWKPCGVA